MARHRSCRCQYKEILKVHANRTPRVRVMCIFVFLQADHFENDMNSIPHFVTDIQRHTDISLTTHTNIILYIDVLRVKIKTKRDKGRCLGQ
jgi:hypothetical protein